MGWEDLTPSEEVEAADWIRERVRGFGVDVGSIIPHGFDAYARIFHPAWRWSLHDPNATEVRWSAVAAAMSRTVHTEMQFHSIAVPAPGKDGAGAPWDGEPRLGVLPPRQVAALVLLLARETSTPDRCWLCLWDGYGYFTAGATAIFTSTFWPEGQAPMQPPPPPQLLLPKAPQRRVRMPGRDYMLFTGSVSQAEGWLDGPNLWWPDDHAWCVASEIDFPYTYVGGTRRLIENILADPSIEALPATTRDRITWDSDSINT
ncbi:MAG TPA: hypothetical protein VLU92_07075 [Candidatus Dormibacteraeota bacterium]|nr:hypothetical protein [Candidatus Dormibacteraeota bacterium]